MSTDEKKKSSVRPERPSHMRVAIVTGSNTGIGRETALGLCREGYHVVMACRNESKALAAIEYLQMECKNASAEFLALDLSSFESVRGFSKAVLKAFSEVKVLVNNAGCSPFSLGDPEQANTGEGFNPIFQINYLAPFYLTQLLLPLLEASAPARIVNLASPMHRRARVEVESFKRTARKMTKATYAVTKLGLVLMSYEMQRRLAAKGVYSVAVSPGGVYRNIPGAFIVHPLFKALMLTNTQGAATSIHAAVGLSEEELSGGQSVYLLPYNMKSYGEYIEFLSTCWGRFAGAVVGKSRKATYNAQVAKNVYDWTLQALEGVL